MKKYLIALVALMALTTLTAEAKEKQKDQSVCYKVNIHCGSCKAKIEKSVPFHKGVKDLDVNMDNNTVTVLYNPTKTDSVKIRQAIEKLDFKVETLKPQAKK